MKKTISIMLAFCMCFLTSAVADARESAIFPDQIRVDGVTLIKNGEGDRLYGLLGVKIYRAALYLPQRSSNDREILNIGTLRVVRMRYFYGASAEDARKAWRTYLEKNCVSTCVWPAQGIDAFLGLADTVGAGDEEHYIFRREGVEVHRNGRHIGRVQAAGFSRLVLSTWVGAAPSTQALKRALLGQK